MIESTMARAVALVAVTLGLVTPAWAGRSTQIDSSIPAPTCYIGAASCGFIDISQSGIYSRAYIYREGIVSIDGLLSAGATSSDPSTFGSVLWFSPGFSDGANYTVSAYRSSGFGVRPVAWGLNFTDVAQNNPFVPNMQVFLGSGTGAFASDGGSWNGVSAVLGYRSPNFLDPEPGAPLPNALIGFGWGGGYTQTVRNADGLLVGPAAADTDFVSTARIFVPGGISFGPNGEPIIAEPSFTAPTRFTPLFAATGVPEPTTWAMLVAGFGMAGAALRRRTRRIAALA